jgi:hypothetical protein
MNNFMNSTKGFSTCVRNNHATRPNESDISYMLQNRLCLDLSTKMVLSSLLYCLLRRSGQCNWPVLPFCVRVLIGQIVADNQMAWFIFWKAVEQSPRTTSNINKHSSLVWKCLFYFSWTQGTEETTRQGKFDTGLSNFYQ